MSMAKIAIDARVYRDSTGRYARKLIENLEKLGSEHECVVLLSPKEFSDYTPKSKNFSKLRAPYPKFSFSEQLGFKTFLDDLGADLVHFTMVQQPIRYHGLKVTTMHDLTALRFRDVDKNKFKFWIKQQAYALVNKSAAKHSARIITASNYVKEDILNFAGIHPKKITVTPEAADEITEKGESISELSGKKFIMYVGRPQAHKNLRRLIEAFRIIKSSHPDLRLVLVGKTDPLYQSHQDYVKQQKIKGVIFTGFVSEGQLRWLYQNTQAYVFPSLSEGFGLPGLEAMAHGAPVISSDATCLPEVHGEAALYFDPTSVEDMATQLHGILGDDKLRQKLIKAGYTRVKEFSWQRMAEQTHQIYNDVLKSS